MDDNQHWKRLRKKGAVYNRYIAGQPDSQWIYIGRLWSKRPGGKWWTYRFRRTYTPYIRSDKRDN